MAQMGTDYMSVYLRKVANNGYAVNLPERCALNSKTNQITNSENQIAKGQVER